MNLSLYFVVIRCRSIFDLPQISRVLDLCGHALLALPLGLWRTVISGSKVFKLFSSLSRYLFIYGRFNLIT
jgi:hypothetical protein